MTYAANDDDQGGQPSALSAAEYEVLLRASQPLVHRSQDAHSGEFASLAALPVLRAEPRSPDAITNNDRRAAQQAPSQPLAQVLEYRRSHTDDLRPLRRSDLATVLARSFRIIDHGLDENGTPWSLRPVPSGGAAHPFDLLVTVAEVHGLQPGHYVYGPNAVSLRRLSADQWNYADVLTAGLTSASRRLEPAPASICLVANVERVAQRYLTALPLLLRDAGALMATIHLVASDLGLRSSIVGTAGHFEHLVAPRSPRDHGGRSPTAVDCVNAHVIPGACAQVIPQVVGPDDVLLRGLLLVISGTLGSLVRPVAGAVHEHLMTRVDQPIQQRLRDDGVGEQRIPVHR